MPTLVERTIIDMKQGSYVMTLPRAWIRYYGLKPGDKLDVIANGDLIVRPKRRRRKRYE